MKLIIILQLLIYATSGFSQNIYLNAQHQITTKDDAVITAAGVMKNSLYVVTGHYIKRPHALACILHYTDSSMKVRQGPCQYFSREGKLTDAGSFNNNERDDLWVGYNLNGKTSDSSLYHEDTLLIMKSYMYFPNGKIMVITTDDVVHDMFYDINFDEMGRFQTFQVPQDYSEFGFGNDSVAKYPGGPNAWISFIENGIMSHIDELGDGDLGTTYIRFIIDTSGKVSDVFPLLKLQSKLSDLGVKLIRSSKPWTPGIENGKKVKQMWIQPLTVGSPGK